MAYSNRSNQTTGSGVTFKTNLKVIIMTDVTKLTEAQLKNLTTVDLLDLDMEEIPDAPEFCNPPTGIYLVDLKLSQAEYERKVYANGTATGETEPDLKFNVNCVIKDLLDVQEKDLDNGEELPRAADRFSNGYFGKTGAQGLVGDMRNVAKHLGITKFQALLETLSKSPIECVVAVERTRRKDKEGNTFLGVKFKDIQVNA